MYHQLKTYTEVKFITGLAKQRSNHNMLITKNNSDTVSTKQTHKY